MNGFCSKATAITVFLLLFSLRFSSHQPTMIIIATMGDDPGLCAFLLTIVSVILIVVTLPASLFLCVKVCITSCIGWWSLISIDVNRDPCRFVKISCSRNNDPLCKMIWHDSYYYFCIFLFFDRSFRNMNEPSFSDWVVWFEVVLEDPAYSSSYHVLTLIVKSTLEQCHSTFRHKK